MTSENRISAFIKLGEKISNLSKEELDELQLRARLENAWFTPENTRRALDGITELLNEKKLREWLSKYDLNAEVPKIVGIVMAGNIPMVGFHDLLCVLLSGHFAAVKISSQDSFLTKKLISWILEVEPKFKKSLEIRERLNNIDAVIATGSDNTARYFEFYFKDIPHIIRKNRSSIAILTGNETAEELKKLGQDIFWYYGLGCRNVSKVLVPLGYKPDFFYESIQEYEEIIHHHKFRNNYDYNKSIYLVNSEPHLDNGFLLWRASNDLVSPISVLFYQEMENDEAIKEYLANNSEKIQCVVGNGYIPFGMAQLPDPWDYADHVDTLAFLSKL
jgi:hypothetical protein